MFYVSARAHGSNSASALNQYTTYTTLPNSMISHHNTIKIAEASSNKNRFLFREGVLNVDIRLSECTIIK